MNPRPLFLLLSALLATPLLKADVEVVVRSTDSSGGKATINLAMTNTFAQPIKEARVWVFLLDANGKVMANKAQWLIGGPDTPKTWQSNDNQDCAITLDVPRPVASTKVTFSRLTLADGTDIDPQKQVKLTGQTPAAPTP